MSQRVRAWVREWEWESMTVSERVSEDEISAQSTLDTWINENCTQEQSGHEEENYVFVMFHHRRFLQPKKNGYSTEGMLKTLLWISPYCESVPIVNKSLLCQFFLRCAPTTVSTWNFASERSENNLGRANKSFLCFFSSKKSLGKG